MQIVIELSDEIYKDIKEENSIYGINNGLSARITGKVVGAIQNGTPLPKGHGRLIDADAFERRCMFDSDIEDMQDVIYALRDYKSIIEADKAESEDKE